MRTLIGTICETILLSVSEQLPNLYEEEQPGLLWRKEQFARDEKAKEGYAGQS